MKPYPPALVLALLCLCFPAFAQDVLKVQPGATITLEPGSALKVQGNISLDAGSTVANNGTFTIESNNPLIAIQILDNTVAPYIAMDRGFFH